MKYAIFSDIHSNLEALTAVLKDMDEQEDIDSLVCLGDLVGYGANPNECCELIFERNPILISGNHDRAAYDLSESRFFNIYAQESSRWTFQNLGEKHKERLKALEQEAVHSDFVIIHGSFVHKNDYILSTFQAEENIELLKEKYPQYKLCFYGHTHCKKVWGVVEGNSHIQKEYKLIRDRFYLINPGSVGQPRDGEPRASYLVYDDEEKLISYYLLEYDIEKAQEKIISAGLPPYLASRLLQGS